MTSETRLRNGQGPWRAKWLSRSTALGAVLGAGLLAACEPAKPGCAVNSVTVTPGSASLAVGSSVPLSAAVSESNCSTTPAVTWTTSASSVASVSNAGNVTAVAEGTATITATAASGSSSASGTASVTVTPAPIATLTIEPSLPSTFVNGTVQLSAVAKDQAGNVLTGRVAVWQSLIPAVATVSPTGLVTGVAVGTGTVTATVEGKLALAPVQVGEAPVASVTVTLNEPNRTPGQTTQAIARLLDPIGTQLVRTVAWESSNPAVATVSPSGVVTAQSPGSTTLKATAEGKSGQAVLTVTQAPVSSIALSVPQATMQVGASQTATATPRGADGNILAGRSVSWQSSVPGVASVSLTGVITANAPGVTAITVTSEGVFAVATVTVLNPVASVTLVLGATTITAGQTTQATAVARDAGGSVVPGVGIVLAVANPAVASISESGLVTALAAGTTNITATAGALVSTVLLTVNPVAVPVASVDVTPGTATIIVGGSAQLQAQPKDGGGLPLAGRQVNWSSSNTGVATVSTGGLVTGVAPGNVAITATSEGQQGSATVTVSAAPIATIDVTASATTAGVGVQITATAIAKDADGNPLTGRTLNWTSSNNGVATVNNEGLVTTVGLGTATITASAEGKSGSVAINVVGFPVLNISSRTPGSNATGVRIESAITITFSENIDPATVSAVSITLTKGGTPVTASRTVTAKTVTITPSAPLTEFNAAYQVTVTPNVRSLLGNTLSTNQQWTFTTVFWDPDYYYRIRNDADGPAKSLDTYSGGGYQCFMGVTDFYTGQYWLFDPIGVGTGIYYMNNLFGGTGRGLEGAAPPGPCFLQASAPGSFTGMMWYPWAVAGQAGRYYLSSLNGGNASALQGGANPHLAPRAAVPSQWWYFTREFHK